jgi:ATP-dependent Clp protease ATP-binding subunit ClpC
LTVPLRNVLDRARERLVFLADGGPAQQEGGNATLEEQAYQFLAEAFHMVSAAGMAGVAQKNNYVRELAQLSVSVLHDPSMENHAKFQAQLFTRYRDVFAQVFPVHGASRDLIPLYLRKYQQILDDMAQIASSQASGRKGPEVERALTEALTFFLNNWTGTLTIVKPSTQAAEGPDLEVLPGGGPSVTRLKSLSHQIREGLYLVHETVPPLPLHPFFYMEGNKAYLFRMLTSEGAFYRALGSGGYSLMFATQLIMDLAEWLLRLGAYGKAIGLYRLAGGKNREAGLFASVLTHCLNAQDYSSRGDAARAVGEWELALTVKPEYPVLYHEMANDCLAANRPQQAISVLNRLLERFPISDEAYVALGDVYAAKADWGRAQRAYEKAMILNPHHPAASDKRQAARVKLEARGAAEGAEKGIAPQEELLSSLTNHVAGRPRVVLAGRDEEVAEVIEILSCRDKKNALLVGDAGVGKTAIIEEVALRLHEGMAPEPLKGKRVQAVNMPALIAGARFRGQFEERVLDLVRRLREKGELAVIENIHQLVHTGGSRGASLDSAALLTPPLSRGEIQVIGTTDDEAFSSLLEKEPSFLKHFHVIRIEELPFEEVKRVIRLRRPSYEAFHAVSIPSELFENSLDLIRTSINTRCLPESALDLMDRTAARVAMRQPVDGTNEVSREDMLLTLAEMSGVSFERLALLSHDRLAGMEGMLKEKIVGQDQAVSAVSRVVRSAKLGMDLDANRPDGVFLFVGPTGVGKTELARRLAEVLFGDEQKLIRIDMSEYMERISTSRLIGTAPGYVGYYDQNQLADQVRRNPYCVILFDEVEKADPQVMNLFLQIFDAGRLTDGKGRTVRFHHATIVMTSNVGTELFSKGKMGYREDGGSGVMDEAVMRQVRANFTPEFLNRIDEIIVFRNLGPDTMASIVDLQLQDLKDRLARQGKSLLLTGEARTLLAKLGYCAEYGARNIGRTLRRYVSEPLAALALRADWQNASKIKVEAIEGKIKVSLSPPPDQVDAEVGQIESSGTHSPRR